MKQDFMHDIRAATQGDRILGFIWHDSVKFQLADCAKNKVMLTSLRSREIGLGHGSHFMRWFTGAADLYGIDISVLAASQGKHADQMRLEAWYERFGFKETRPGCGYDRLRIAGEMVGAERVELPTSSV